jgi:oligoribonuclease NrnB/cAMP/cGMP phosphodiesterase (DHH superfamily)
MNKKFKVLVVHHNNDLDGIFSGVLATKFYEIFSREVPNEYFEYEIVGYNYGKDESVDTWLNPFDKDGFKKYDHIQFIDVTPPIKYFDNVFKLMHDRELCVEIFDHHQYAFNSIMDIFKEDESLVNDNLIYHYHGDKCGAKIFYDCVIHDNFWILMLNENINYNTNIFNDKEKTLKKYTKNIRESIDNSFITKSISYLIDLVDSYDLWKWKNETPNNIDALALNEYFLQWDYETVIYEKICECILFNYTKKQILENVLHKGHRMIEFKTLESFKEKHILLDLYDIKFVVVNAKANVYSIDNILSKFGDEYSFALFYKNMDFVNGVVNISLRSINNDFDCNAFVKKITDNNGGGHKSASGGQMKISKFIDLLTK